MTVSRRALTRGAAWAVPVVATATAAPALAVSGLPTDGPADFAWIRLTWTPSDTGVSMLTATAGVQNTNGLSDLSTQAITLLGVEAHTTYQAPAANAGPQLVVAQPLGRTPVWTLKPKQQLAFDVSFNSQLWKPTPPRDASGTDISRSYYSGTADGKVPCVPSFVRSTDPRYPYAAHRLTLDSAYLLLTYTDGSTTYVAVGPMNSEVKAKVDGSYCT